MAENLVNFNNFINNKRLVNEYQLIANQQALGYGTFGVVIKATNKIDDKEYAIKMIAIRGYSKPQSEKDKTMDEEFNDKIRELKIWAQLTELDYFVQYRSAWLEKDPESKARFLKYFHESIPDEEISSELLATYKPLEMAVLHIQMDLCPLSLKDAINQMNSLFKPSHLQLVCKLQYYISAEMLSEILEAVNYLHTHQPQIIHRDIKPANILVKFTVQGRSVKLADFGLAVLHESASQSHTQNQGAEKYMAPEVRQSRKYSTKADVYSIGVIIEKMFNFDINRNDPNNYNENEQKIIEVADSMLNGMARGRPTCDELLRKREEWVLPYGEIQQEIEGTVNLSQEYNIQDQFVMKFLQMKRKLHIN